MTGTVLSYNSHHKYGFIKGECENYFFHITDAYKGVLVGDEVTFELEDKKARRVEKVGN